MMVAVLKEMLAVTGWIVMLGMTASYSHASGNLITTVSHADAVTMQALALYDRIEFGQYQKLRKEVFVKALTGYRNLYRNGYVQRSGNILSVCDFSLSSNVPRLWVIDLDSAKVLFNTLVAHGAGTGDEYARFFSNRPESHQSSMGFYITGDTYQGNNGYSLRLSGMDTGYNDRAAARAIVMHGAPYVSEQFIQSHNRLGHSWGCPAIPQELTQPVINTIKNGTCLFIFSEDQQYLEASAWLQADFPASPNERVSHMQYEAISGKMTDQNDTESGAEKTETGNLFPALLKNNAAQNSLVTSGF